MNLKQSFIKMSSAFLLPAALLAVAVPAQAQQQLTQNKVVAPTRQNVTIGPKGGVRMRVVGRRPPVLAPSRARPAAAVSA